MPNSDHPVAGRPYRLLAVAGAVIAAVLLLLTWTPLFGSRRPPNDSEQVFAYFAESLGEAALCEKISWDAFQRYSVMFGGGGASYARSDCYESVAIRNQDRFVCWNVRPLVDFDPWSAGYSALSCRRRPTSGGRHYASLAPETVIRTFDALGYDVDQLHLEGVIEQAIRPADVYRALERSPGIADRVREALDRDAAALDAGDRSFLVHLAAVATGNAHWCDRIPEREASESATVPFRDWCYLTIAFNLQDARICERMAPAAAEAKVVAAKAAGVRPDIAEELSARADCMRIRQWKGPPPHYGRKCRTIPCRAGG
jgi:hypothetical protein